MDKTVAILRGGPSGQYTRSLETGNFVLSHLPSGWTGRDVFIDREGKWHVAGLPVSPAKAVAGAHAIWNALHGEYGEDGKVQKILHATGVPYVGSDPVSSATAMNKKMAKRIFEREQILTAPHVVIQYGDDLDAKARDIFFNFHMPVVIKPVSSGGSVGVSVASSLPELKPLIEEALVVASTVLVEAYIWGTEVTAIVVEGMRNEPLYTPIPVHITLPKGSDIYALDHKNAKASLHDIALHLGHEVLAEVAKIAQKAHQALGLRHYSASDMKITKSGKIYLLETNTVPVLHDESPIVLSLSSVGISPTDFIAHLLKRV